jgi:hypothetical protein
MNDQQRAGRIALEDSKERSKRIRVGLTGLCGIVLIVGLASAMMSQLTASVSKAPGASASGNVAAPSAVAAQGEPVEPLAELGVAPGARDVPATRPAP